MSPHDFTAASRLLHDREVSAELLDEWTRQAAAPKPASTQGRLSAMLLRAGDEWLALPGAMLDEALPVGPVHAVPYLSSQVFLGLTNVGGELLPCVSLAALLGCPPAALPSKPRLVAVGTPQGRFALKVEEVLGVCQYQPGELSKAPDTLLRSPSPLVRAMVSLEGRAAGLLDQHGLGLALGRSLTP